MQSCLRVFRYVQKGLVSPSISTPTIRVFNMFHPHKLDLLRCFFLCRLESLPICSTSCPLVFLVEPVFPSGLTADFSCHPGLVPLCWCHLRRDVHCHGVIGVGLKLLPAVLDGVIIQGLYEALWPDLHVFLHLQPPGLGEDKYLPRWLPINGRGLCAVHNYCPVVVKYPQDDSCGLTKVGWLQRCRGPGLGHPW